MLLEAGQVERAMRQAARQLRATYLQPYQAHASIGPSCAVADVAPDHITVWCSTAGPYPLRGALAQLLQVPPEKIHLVHMEGAGSYGQNGADDAAADAVILSREVGRPVRVQWSRAHEFIWEPKAAAMVCEVAGGLDATGPDRRLAIRCLVANSCRPAALRRPAHLGAMDGQPGAA